VQTRTGQPEAVRRVRAEVFEREYLGRAIPVIIIDALNNWEALHRWSPEYLASVLKEKQTIVAVSKEDRFNHSPSVNDGNILQYQTKTMDFISAVSKIVRSDSTSERYYVMQESIPDAFPELLRDIKTPRWIEPGKLTTNLWFGTANNVSPLHYDDDNNFFAQVYGRKHMTLFDPVQTEWLYPYPIHAVMKHLSFVDIENPDLIRHPEYRKAQPMECVLGPGELLYLPAYWWHHVRSLDVSISISFWWPPNLQQILLSPNAVRALPSLYEKTRLMDVKRILVGAGLDFLKTAMMLCHKNQKWAAILLAGAALDEFLRKLSHDHGLTEEASDNLSSILMINSRLQTANVYSCDDAMKVTVWAEMINQALAGDNDRFSDAGVASFINEIRSFTKAQ
jgi:jumonji domain-containing protein 7